MKKLEALGKKTVNQLIEKAKYGWLPDCVGYIYQPERPAIEKAQLSNKKKPSCKK